MNEDQNNTSPENIPVIPAQQGQKKPKWFWVLVAVVIFGGGVVILIFVGDVFIREVTQDVIIEERNTEVQPQKDSEEVRLQRDPEVGLQRGEAGHRLAPYFELENLKGEKVKISDFLGSPVVVTFWTTWNTLSVDQVRILEEVELPGEVQLQIIAINSQEDKSIVSNFIERGGYDVEVLLDENGAVGEMYGIQTLPVTYFLDKEGNMADMYVGLLDAKAIVDKIGKILNKY